MVAKHILACVDFSEQSTRALAHVGEYARANGSKVTLIHIADPQAFIPPQAIVEPLAVRDETKHREALVTFRDRHLADLEVDVEIIADHAPARAICDYAEKHGIDLIVVGSHGRSGIERWLIGSVAERVVRHAASDVYVVRR